MHMGFGFYYAPRLAVKGDAVIQVAELFARAMLPERVRFQGMRAGTDRFSPLRTLGRDVAAQLRPHLEAGDFSDLLFYSGSKTDPVGQLGIRVQPSDNVRYQFGSCEMKADTPESLDAAYRLATEFVQVLGSPYAFVVLGESPVAVFSEITATPVRPWDAPEEDSEEDERLFRIQDARPELGDRVRGATWGMFLGPGLVEALGGPERVTAEAPVPVIDRKLGGVLYLQVSREPQLLGTAEYRGSTRRVEEYLKPIMPGDVFSD